MRVTTTRMGVMLDTLCFDVLETDTGGVVETSLGENAGLAGVLAAQGHELQLGSTVILPDKSAAIPEIKQIKLWD